MKKLHLDPEGVQFQLRATRGGMSEIFYPNEVIPELLKRENSFETDSPIPENRRHRSRRSALSGGQARAVVDSFFAHAGLGRHRTHVSAVRQGRLDREGAPAARQSAYGAGQDQDRRVVPYPGGGVQQTGSAAAPGLLQCGGGDGSGGAAS